MSALKTFVSIPFHEYSKTSLKICFICGATETMMDFYDPFLTSRITFFKSNIEEWKIEENNETCSQCLKLVNKVYILNQQITELQTIIKNIVVVAYAKRHEMNKKTQEEISKTSYQEKGADSEVKSDKITTTARQKKMWDPEKLEMSSKIINKIDQADEEDADFNSMLEQETERETNSEAEQSKNEMENSNASAEVKIQKTTSSTSPKKRKIEMETPPTIKEIIDNKTNLTQKEPTEPECKKSRRKTFQKPKADYEQISKDPTSADFNPASTIFRKRKYYCCSVKGCEIKEFNINVLKEHMKKHMLKEGHPNWNPLRGGYNCSKCGLRIKDHDRFLLHTKVCIEQEQLTPTDSKTDEFPCTICFKIFQKKYELKNHMIRHNPEKPYGCEFCDLRHSTKCGLKLHRKKAHDIKVSRPFHCETCKQQFVLKEQLEEHKKIHDRMYECSFCNKKFRRNSNLRAHIKIHEKEEEKEEIIYSFSCDKCPKKFSNQQKLDFHLDFHKMKDSRPFSCEECEVTFNSKEKLDKHLTDAEAHNEGTYLCQYCEKTFSKVKNVIKHESYKHGIKNQKSQAKTTRDS